MNERLTVIGGGLAGCEAAWQAARCGVDVDLYEMRPHRSGPAHQTGALAELVCSNSLRGAALENAVGLLKEELARLDSIVITSAREAAVPAGGALAVDRERFAHAVESRIASEPRITLHREAVDTIPLDRPCIIACGPLPSDELLASIDAVLESIDVTSARREGALQRSLTGVTLSAANSGVTLSAANSGVTLSAANSGVTLSAVSEANEVEGRRAKRRRLHYFDAASPIVSTDSIDETPMYRKSRYEKGDGDDYLNIPLDRDQYAQLLADLRTLPRHQAKDFEEGTKYFEGCLPIEEMADRGDDTLRYGPMKPVGLRDPRTGKTPHAVVQLRKENAEGTAWNLVGFQTRMTWPAQKEAFSKLPGLANAEWLRLGVMHRNTFIDSPRLLDETLKLSGTEALYFAGQITGAEGYVEAAACGAMTGIHAARTMLGREPIAFPRESAFGAVVAHLQNRESPDFQPANVTWAPFPPLLPEIREKKLRRAAMAARALAAIDAFVERLARDRVLV